MLKNILTGNVVIGYVFNKISISDDREKNIVSTQFRASPFERALFSALNRVLLIN
ncbi:hypothetical protein K260102G11_18080 [Bacteroides uniformis]